MVLLLASLAIVQYRWSTRVAAADAQREKEHLDSGAALFASEFNGIAAQAQAFLQSTAWAALQSGDRLTGVPKLIGELYYLELEPQGTRNTRRLTEEGLFAPVALPEWIAKVHCAELAVEQPPALLAPIFDTGTSERSGTAELRVLKTFRWRSDRCFVARIDQTYLRETLVPRLISQSFGATAAAEYDFAVVPLSASRDAFYGDPSVPTRADLRKPFFSIPGPLALLNRRLDGIPGGRQSVYVQHVETVRGQGRTTLANVLGPGLWELDVAHKGLPLTAAFEQRRQRDWLLSLGVEFLLLAAIGFLVIGARRMQQLAEQKMQFIAGVSHELRTPVSAISMLSRNQADGLIAGPERVKQYGELIHQQSRRLNEMVEQTLQYAGIHSGLRRPAKDRVDLREVIEQAVEARREELARGGFQVEIALSPDLPAVSGDAKLLRTALDNLLSNAEKYGDGGRWIRVKARYLAQEKEVQTGAEERGAGIAPAAQEEIFGPFRRGPAALDAQIPGSGLGLSLVRSAAEAHRGSVTLVSEPGRGSTFTLHLPA